MANRKREVYKPKPMTEGKRNLIQGLLQEYDIQSADDIQEALKDLLSGTIQDMLETEMDNHLGYDRYERSGESNYRKDLKTIYTAADEEAARKQLKTVTEKWSGQYPSAMNRWHDNWDAISPIFKFSKEVRTAFYTTNAIESLNSCYRRLNKQRSVFPSSQALLKALYLGTFEIAKKWTMPIRNWGKVRGELEIMYPDRMQI